MRVKNGTHCNRRAKFLGSLHSTLQRDCLRWKIALYTNYDYRSVHAGDLHFSAKMSNSYASMIVNNYIPDVS